MKKLEIPGYNCSKEELLKFLEELQKQHSPAFEPYYNINSWMAVVKSGKVSNTVFTEGDRKRLFAFFENNKSTLLLQ
jgi:hypothetical protein